MPALRVTATAVALLLLTACANPSSTEPAPTPAARPPATAASGTPAAATGGTGTPAPSGDVTATGDPRLDDVGLALVPLVELAAPTALTTRPGDDPALYIGERGGRVVRVVDGVVDGGPVLDISADTTTDAERGLLGIAFSPDGSELYVSFTDPQGTSRLDAFTMDGDRAATRSRRTLLEVAQPYANHNGGHVVTGPDGLLYYGLGDGGAAGDPQGNGQDTTTLLGALLRIAPDGADGAYDIPRDNPFADAGDDTRPEIWIYGLRNPWRFSFDRATDDLWIGDVGQGALEEIDRLAFDAAGGANLGWNVFEGTRRYGDGRAPDAVAPVHEYPHDTRCSVTGGHVYRGDAIAGLQGAYLYGDYCDGVVRGIVVDGDQVTQERAFDATVPELVSFGEDAAGELYALSLAGTVFRLVPSD